MFSHKDQTEIETVIKDIESDCEHITQQMKINNGLEIIQEILPT